MPSVNRVILVGHLGRDPEARVMTSGEAVTNFSLATSETRKDKSGAKQEETVWHAITFFGPVAEVCAKYLKKGALVYVEGKITVRTYTAKDGTEKTVTEIRGDRMQMLGGKDEAREEAPAKPQAAKRQRLEDLDDDIPF